MSDATTTESASERALVEAKLTLDDAIEEFTRSQRLGQENILVASERLHTAVIGLWWRMRPHLHDDDGWEDLAEFDGIEADAIYSGTHPETGRKIEISGLQDLEEWIDKTVQVAEDQSGPNSSRSSSHRSVTVRLPAEAAIRAAKVLSNQFHAYGWDAQASQGLPGQDDFNPAGDDLEIQRKDKEDIV